MQNVLQADARMGTAAAERSQLLWDTRMRDKQPGVLHTQPWCGPYLKKRIPLGAYPVGHDVVSRALDLPVLQQRRNHVRRSLHGGHRRQVRLSLASLPSAG